MKTYPLMPFRKEQLEQAYYGYQEYGVPFVGTANGQPFPIGLSDDLGIYYLVPKISHLLGLDFTNGIFWSLALIALIAVTLGTTGCFYFFKSRTSALIATIWLLYTFGYIFFLSGDIYFLGAASALAICPWALGIFTHSKTNTKSYIFCLLAGLWFGLSLYLRKDIAYPGLIFILAAIAWVHPAYLWKKILLIMTLALGFSLSHQWIQHLLTQRDQFLALHEIEVKPENNHHPFWHSAYIGLGHKPNPEGIQYLDEVGYKKAQTINSNVTFFSPEYEAILKKLYFKFIRDYPFTYVKIMLQKAISSFSRSLPTYREEWGLVLFVRHLILFLGIFCLYRLFINRHQMGVQLAFASSLIIAIIPGILVVPRQDYLTGFSMFFTFLIIWSLFEYNDFLERKV